MLEIEYRPRAEADLDGILTYLVMAIKSPQAARTVAAEIFSAIERAAELPEIGRLLQDDSLEHAAYRCTIAHNYRIYYRVRGETLTVWRIFHTSQDTDEYGFTLFDD